MKKVIILMLVFVAVLSAFVVGTLFGSYFQTGRAVARYEGERGVHLAVLEMQEEVIGRLSRETARLELENQAWRDAAEPVLKKFDKDSLYAKMGPRPETLQAALNPCITSSGVWSAECVYHEVAKSDEIPIRITFARPLSR